MLTKKDIKKIKEKLNKEKELIEKELKSFAENNKSIRYDWKAKYPEFSADSSGLAQKLEEGADEVEEYSNLISIEHNLELRLKDINLAIERIENNTYGNCLKCGNKIDEKKLKLYPETKFCNKCQ
jgi:DnaK suppressor protein